jgi:hypothetical protein
MTDDPLKRLLHRADAQSEPALMPAGEMVRRVESAVRRQQQRRATAVAVVIPIMFAIVGLTAWRPSRNPAPEVQREPAIAISNRSIPAAEQQLTPFGPDKVERVRQEIAALEAEADLHLQIARRMIADRERDVTLALARSALTDDEPSEAVRERLDLVAFRMIARADRLRSEPRRNEDPVAIYREVVRLFPTTDSATEARLRLAELDPIQPPGGA